VMKTLASDRQSVFGAGIVSAAPLPTMPRPLRPHHRLAGILRMAVSRLLFGIPMDPSTTLHLIVIVGVLAVCLALVTHRREPPNRRRPPSRWLTPRAFGVANPLPPSPAELFPEVLTAAWKRPHEDRMASDSGRMWATAIRRRTPEAPASKQLRGSDGEFLGRNAATARIVKALQKCGRGRVRWGTDHVIYAWFHVGPHSPGRIYVGKTTSFGDRFHDHLYNGARTSRADIGAPSAAADAYQLYKWMGHHGVDDLVMIPLEAVQHDTEDVWHAASTARERWWINELRSLAPHGYNSRLPGRRDTRYSELCGNLPAGLEPHVYGFPDPLEVIALPASMTSSHWDNPDPAPGVPGRAYRRRVLALAKVLDRSGPDALRAHISRQSPSKPFRYRNLRRCLVSACLSRFEPDDMSTASQHAVAQALEEEILQRQQQSSSKRHELRVSYAPIMEHCGLSSLVTTATQHALLPREVCNSARIKLSHTYSTPIGAVLCNASQFAACRSLEELEALADGRGPPCACAGMPPDFLRDCSAAAPNAPCGRHMHVWTCDPDFAAVAARRVPGAAALFAQGSKFRPSLPEYADASMTTRMAAVRAIEAAADRLQTRLRREYDNPALDLRPWLDHLLAAFNAALDGVPDGMQLGHPDALQSDAATLKALPAAFSDGQFVVTKVDKASQCFGFMCSRVYAAKYLRELRGRTAHNPFSPTPLTTDAAVYAIADGYAALGLPRLAANFWRLATVSLTQKEHKPPSGCETRAVTHSSRVATTPAARWLHILAKGLNHSMLAKWAQVVLDHRLKPDKYKPWSIKSSAGFVAKLSQFNASRSAEELDRTPAPHMDAYDVVSLFHSISQAGCKQQWRAACELHWAGSHKTRGFRLYQDGSASWQADSEEPIPVHARYMPSYNGNPSSYVVDFYSAVSLCDFVLDNAYLKASTDTVLHQTGGIPMGGNASPDLANLYLGMHELGFFTHLLGLATLYTDAADILPEMAAMPGGPPNWPALRGKMAENKATMQRGVSERALELMDRFCYTARFADDIAVVNNPDFLTYASGDGSPLLFEDPGHANPFAGRMFLFRDPVRTTVAAGRSFNKVWRDASLPRLYPSELSFKSSSGGLQTIFMDTVVMRADGDRGRLVTRLYDKCAEPEFRFAISRYQHFSSCMAAAKKYNTVTSQLHRFRSILTYWREFERATARLLYLLEQRGHDPAKMIALCRCFLRDRRAGPDGAGPQDTMADILRLLDGARARGRPPALQLKDERPIPGG